MGGVSEELEQYINSCRQLGQQDETIKQTLIGAGWSEGDVKTALNPDINETVVLPKEDTVATNPTADKQTPDQARPKRKYLKLALIGLAILLVFGSVGWFVYPLFLPETLVVASLSKLINRDIKQYELTGEFIVTPKLSRAVHLPLSNMKISFETAVDDNPPGKGRMLVNAVGIDEGASDETASLELRWLEKVFYFKLAIQSQTLATLGADAFNDKWYSFNYAKLTEDLGLNERYNTNINDDQLKQLQDAYRKYPFIVVSSKLGKRVVNDQQVEGYKLSYDDEQFSSWLVEMERITNQPNPRSKEEISQQGDDPAEVGEIKLWIVKKTKTPVEIEYNLEPSDDVDGFKARITLVAIGKPIVVEKPDPVVPLEDMINQWQNDLFKGTGQMSSLQKLLLSGKKK